MDNGMILSEVYDLMKQKTPGEAMTMSHPEWYGSFERDGIDLVLKPGASDETSSLSEFERRVLEGVDEEFGSKSFKELREITHRLPEYVEPHGSSVDIEFTKILEATGWEESEIEDKQALAENINALKKLLAS